MSATLLQFARVNDAAAATTSKLAKTALLADYFRTLDDEDLKLAVWYCAGWAFGEGGKVLNVGGAIVSDVLLDLLRIDPREFHHLSVKSGEIGEALSKIWTARREATPTDSNPWLPPADPTLTLHDLSIAFDDLSRTGNAENKREILKQIFQKCSDPREPAYLTKILFNELRTGVQLGTLQAAVAKAFDKTLAEIQRTQLLVGDLAEVAILAKHDALGTAKFRLFHPIQFMLATPEETPDEALKTMNGKPFYVEDKLDGIRAQVHKSGNDVVIYTRTMGRADAAFPDVADALRHLPGDFLLDGEIVPYCDGCVLPFASIQRRLGRKVLTRAMLEDHPAVFIAFDVLYLNGRLLMDEPLRERRKTLDTMSRPAPGTYTNLANQNLTPGHDPGQTALFATAYSEVSTADQIDRAFNDSKSRRNEGIILKDPDSIYSPGRRGQSWLKLKTHLPTLDCVVTAAEFGHGKRRDVLSDYTFAVWDRDPADDGAQLVNIGKAYSGCTDEEIAQLTELFLKLSHRQYGRVHQVEPKIVLEIACDQIQKSTRHASGYAMRFPRIKRIRWDKGPTDADRLSRVEEIYQSPTNTAFAPPKKEPKIKPPEPTLFDHLG